MNSKERFSTHVENYAKYRSSYPSQAIEFIESKFYIGSKTVIADIGSGTGIFTCLLARHAP